MRESCTREEIRELDRRAIEEYGVPGVVLMENAGRGATDVAVRMLGGNPAGRRVVIFCGRGNNGGDGYVIARHLHNAGARVDLILAFDPATLQEGDAATNFAIARAMSLPVTRAESEEGQTRAGALGKEADLIVDALLGTGLAGDVRAPYCSLIRLINAEDKPVLSVDIPSGLDANLGTVLRCAVRATRTATFVLPKRGFFVDEGKAHIGEVDVIDIGMPRALIDSLDDELSA